MVLHCVGVIQTSLYSAVAQAGIAQSLTAYLKQPMYASNEHMADRQEQCCQTIAAHIFKGRYIHIYWSQDLSEVPFASSNAVVAWWHRECLQGLSLQTRAQLHGCLLLRCEALLQCLQSHRRSQGQHAPP